ncbi:MAG: hypothetical protein WAW06_04680 [bacterium]
MRLASMLALLAVLCASAGRDRAAAAEPAALTARHLASVACVDRDTNLRFSPLGLAFGLEGDLYLVDADNSSIYRIDDSTLAGANPDPAPVLFARSPEELGRAELVDIVADAGWFYVSERAGGLVAILDSRGDLVRADTVGQGIGGIGLDGAGAVYGAMTLAGSVVIADLWDGGSPIQCVPSVRGGQAYPLDCYCHRSGRVFVTDDFSRRVLILDALGKNLGVLEGFKFERPFGVCGYGRDLVLVSDSQLASVAVFDSSGKWIAEFGRGHLKTPVFIAARDDGTVCVSDAAKMTVEVFRIERFGDNQ